MKNFFYPFLILLSFFIVSFTTDSLSENKNKLTIENSNTFKLSDGKILNRNELIERIKKKELKRIDAINGLKFLFESSNNEDLKNAIAENFANGIARPKKAFKNQAEALIYIKNRLGNNEDLINRIWNNVKEDKRFYDESFSFEKILNFFDLTSYPPIVIKVILISLFAIIGDIIYKKMLIKDKAKENQKKELNLKILSENINNSLKTNTIQQQENSDLIFKHEVKIINQVWLLKNLDVDRFNNGDEIYEARTEEEWEKAFKNKQPAWCYYENKHENNFIYGKLYNYYAVTDIRGIAPSGYRVPTINDWDILINNLGGKNTAGEFLKSEMFWNLNKISRPSSVSYGENKLQLQKVISVFDAVPGGIRKEYGTFTSIGKDGHWWSIPNENNNITKYVSLGYYNNSVFYNDINFGYGLSVRCIKA